jgi:hypothetical protein
VVNEFPCPTCGHLHPSGVGAAICGCHDCFLLWQTNIRFEHLAPQFQQRLTELREMQSAKATS